VRLHGMSSLAGASDFIRAISQAYKNPRSSISAEAVVSRNSGGGGALWQSNGGWREAAIGYSRSLRILRLRMDRMTKRIAVVTGGMGGLGEAISTKLHDAGYAVVVTHSPNNTGADDWLARMETQGRNIRAYPIDVADYDSCQHCAARIQADVGPVDILVNNAGITQDMTLRKMDKVNWDAVIRTNLDSVFNMTKPLCEDMVARGWGRIVNISSVNGSKGSVGQTNYAAAKAGMHGFTKSLALEVARKGVTVNTISPGYLATKMVTAIPQEILDTKVLPHIPMGRLGKPEEVAALVLYLCSDDAGFVTGSNIAINGGQHMQ
jgi:acetoacetyl-CoA reductase